MTKKITTWHGVDSSKEESLFVYGCLCRYVPENKAYQVIYRHPHIMGNWDWTSMTETQVDEFLQEDWLNKDGFLSYVGMTESEWLELTLIQKFHDLISWKNVVNFVGESYSEGMDTKEVCKMTRIAYDESYVLQ